MLGRGGASPRLLHVVYFKPTGIFSMFNRIAVFLCATLLLAGVAAPPAYADDAPGELRIVRITPAGEDVPATRQIVIEFNKDVVPVGRMERDDDEVPVHIEPALDCQWRWINRSALACQLDDTGQMTKATAYTVTVGAAIEASDGSVLEDPYSHSFITDRPHIRYVHFRKWDSPSMPVLRLTFDQPVGRDSVKRHVFLAKGKMRTSLSVEPDPDNRELPRYFLIPGESMVLDTGASQTQESDDDPRVVNGQEARRVWLVKPREELSLDAEYDLRVEPGLVSALGPEEGAERRVAKSFTTFPDFEFLGVFCRNNANEELVITPETSGDPELRCNPLGGAALVFSVPVLNSEVKNNIVFDPDLAGGREDYDPWENRGDYSRLRQPHRKGRTYKVWLPEYLQGWQGYHVSTKAARRDWSEKLQSWFVDLPQTDLKDEFGRRLHDAIDLSFYTDHRKPDFTIGHRTAVLEEQVDASEVPLYVTNLDTVTLGYTKLTADARAEKQELALDVPDVEDVSFAVPLKVRDMLDGENGAVYGQVNSDPVADKHPSERLFFAQVTPWQLHVKAGHFNTLVWVTDFATGEPVPGAKVDIYKDAISDLEHMDKTLDSARTGKDGIALIAGTEKLDPEIETFHWRCNSDDCDRLFVRVVRDGKIAVLPLHDRFKVDAWRAAGGSAWPRQKKIYGHIETWGTTAQGVYRAGSTIQYKLYVRNQDNDAFTAPPRDGYTLEIIGPDGKTAHEVKDVKLSEFGAFDGEFTVPENAMVGWYAFKLSAGFTGYTWRPMEVLVSDFTPAPFRATVGINGTRFMPGDTVEAHAQAELHSGGVWTDAETRVTARIRAKGFSAKHALIDDFTFQTAGQASAASVIRKTERLDDKGVYDLSFDLPEDSGVIYGTLQVEAAVRDDRGKYIADMTTAEYIARDRLAGLKTTRWVYRAGEEADILYAVADADGQPVSGHKVEVLIEREDVKTARVKGAGNAYLTNFVKEWVRVDTCAGVSGEEPGACTFTPPQPGYYRATATLKDTKGREHETQRHLWVSGKGATVWETENNDSLDLVPEKDSYQIGETARYLVKNPYPGAKALVTVERYGVLKQWVETFDSGTPVVEFEVEPDFLPGYYLSVVVMSPRVAQPLGEGNVDLGKPSFKIGYAVARVKDPFKEIDIDIKTDSDTYKPRDKVKATIRASVKDAKAAPEMEFAVAVLDESVFDLIQGGRDYFDPYTGFYRLDSLDLKNYSLLKRLVGRQKFEKKGANSGGDGGMDMKMRSLFKFVSYWNPSVKPDRNGVAEIEFEVPDNLTGWRILTLAVTKSDRMGLGEGTFKVNQPVELRPVMPNQVIEGDSFKAGFSVMNRTDEARELTVEITASGNVKTDDAETVHSETVTVEPYKRATVHLPLTAGRLPALRHVSEGEIVFAVTATDGTESDGLTYSLPVRKYRSLLTAAEYGTTTEDAVTEDFKFPENIHTDVGEVSVVLAPSVIGNVAGAFEYMRDYPYICWEQKLTRGVMAAHYTQLKPWLPDDVVWEDSAELPAKMLAQAASHQAPNGGMAYFVPTSDRVSPYLSAYTALAFNWLRKSGHEIPAAVEEKLHGYLKELLRKDVVPGFFTPGMASTVRAVALAALAEHGDVSLPDLERHAPHSPQMSLFGKAHLLQAALKIDGGAEIAAQIRDEVLAHSVQSGGKISFNEELDDSYSRILATPLRANCSVLTSLMFAKENGDAHDIGDLPFKLVRFLTQSRGSRTHWENTQENMFCMNALIDYSRVYENAKPDMRVMASMDEHDFGSGSFDDFRDAPLEFKRPITAEDPGRDAKLIVSRSGAGRLYYAARLSYAPTAEFDAHTNAGIDIRKEYSVERDGTWTLLDTVSQVRRGELVRVDIYVSLPTARNFVVVDDPVPGGLEPVNRDLATASIVDAEKGDYKAAGGSWWFKYSDWRHYSASLWSFYHRELKHDAVRFYSDYLPAGNYHLSYTAQAIAPGAFVKMPVHAEEMYDPDVFGKGVAGKLVVDDAAE